MRELIMLISHSAECKGGLIVVSTPSPSGAYRISDSFNFISPQCTLKPDVGDVNHPPPLAMCCPSRLGTLGHPPLDNTNINAYGRLNYGPNKIRLGPPRCRVLRMFRFTPLLNGSKARLRPMMGRPDPMAS